MFAGFSDFRGFWWVFGGFSRFFLVIFVGFRRFLVGFRVKGVILVALGIPTGFPQRGYNLFGTYAQGLYPFGSPKGAIPKGYPEGVITLLRVPKGPQRAFGSPKGFPKGQAFWGYTHFGVPKG